MIASIEPQGVLVGDCSLQGERKRDGVFPAHPCGIQLSRNRWLFLYATRALRCYDDDHSIVYQVRADSPVGPVLKEGFLQRTVDDYDPLGDGSANVCILRQAMAFGVPLGARVGGRRVPHENVFVAQWSRSAGGRLDPATGTYVNDSKLEWGCIDAISCQFRLNAKGDDLEILQPPRKLRQVGYEQGPAFCSSENAGIIVAGLVPAVPFNDDLTEWATTMQVGKGVAALKFRFNARAGLYEWVETGPSRAGNEEFSFSEPTMARVDGAWLIAVRTRFLDPRQEPDWAGFRTRDRGHTGWIRVADPFREMPFSTIVTDPPRQAPMTIHRCADGVVRLFSGDFANSPYKARRDPLYCWDVDPRKFTVSHRHVVCDTVEQEIFPNDDKLQRSTCFGYVFPHTGGKVQYVAHRVMCFRYRAGVDSKAPPITPEQLERHAIHYSEIRYDRECAPTWRFA
ncbi:MAG: hypothetical protein IT578_01665 [Verrucomicrobiae bacterium]|nr:hypothetical protein [Verrucomicrobiae bacterium]